MLGNSMIPQDWFEMADIRRRNIRDSVWIPLHASEERKTGKLFYEGFQGDVFAVNTVAIPVDRRSEADDLDWSELGGRNQGPYAFRNSYKPADVYQRNDEEDLGVDLVIVQNITGEENVWHLNVDLVMALNLKREGNSWVLPDEGYIEVVRMRHNDDGSPAIIEIRSEYLRDYLAARRMALRISAYRERRAVLPSISHIDWPADGLNVSGEGSRFKTITWETFEDGRRPGDTMAVFRVGRTDVDVGADVPTMGPETDGNTEGETWSGVAQGARVLHFVEGAFWRDEWLEPATNSPRVRGDKIRSDVSFVVAANGDRMNVDALNNEDVGRWLWFNPRVVPAILEGRGSGLAWYTLQTGGVQSTSGRSIHFGLNSSNLVTVYAYDIARLPEWQRRLWAGFNVTPDGRVSEELLSAQTRAIVAETQPPETEFAEALERLDNAVEKRWGAPLLVQHAETKAIIASVHRFRAQDQKGLLNLAKDVARLTADSIDRGVLQKVAPTPKGQNRGSLKSLEAALATIVDAARARALTGPLFGTYDLRLGDAHLASETIKESFALVGIDPNTHPISQGAQLLKAVADALMRIAEVIATEACKDGPETT